MLAEGLQKALQEHGSDATNYAFANKALGELHKDAGKDWKSLRSIYEDLIRARHLKQPDGRPVTFVLYSNGRGRLSMWQLWVRVPLPPGDEELYREMPTVLHGSVITDLSRWRSKPPVAPQTLPSPGVSPAAPESTAVERAETTQPPAVAEPTAPSETPGPNGSKTHPSTEIEKSPQVVVIDLTSKHLSNTASLGHALLQAVLPLLVLLGLTVVTLGLLGDRVDALGSWLERVLGGLSLPRVFF